MLAATVVTAGCAGEQEGTPSPAPGNGERPGSSTAAPPGGDSGYDIGKLNGTWKGTYLCPEGPGGLTVEIDEYNGEFASATVSLATADGGPEITPGSHRSDAFLSDDGTILFASIRWIEQAEGTGMIDFGITEVAGDAMMGYVLGEAGQRGCTDVVLNRQ
ncbi:hypothetical protein BAY61_03340 [Prauserella marina]|nr:hypothetical protein BAY61_03340 [Prauserella marina]